MGDKGQYPGQGMRAAGTGVTGDCTRSPINRKQREWDRSNHREADGLKTGIRRQTTVGIWQDADSEAACLNMS